jgi:hemerythrin-like domain-containing protein
MQNSPSSRTEADAFVVLIEAHRALQKIFRDFEKLKQASLDEDEKAELVFAACNQLKIHAQLEDELFYPAVRPLINDDDLMEEARLEHGTANELIARLDTMQPSHPLYDTCFTFLGECINHHIGEEEHEIFPKARAAGLDAAALGRELNQRKQQLEGLGATLPPPA